MCSSRRRTEAVAASTNRGISPAARRRSRTLTPGQAQLTRPGSRHLPEAANRGSLMGADARAHRSQRNLMTSSNSVIEARDLTKAYGKTPVLKGIDLQVERGSMVALLGPNGAGKTTTVRILS